MTNKMAVMFLLAVVATAVQARLIASELLPPPRRR